MARAIRAKRPKQARQALFEFWAIVVVYGVLLVADWKFILLMAPLHHHFEKTGWTETQVVVRFWIITMLLCLVGLSTLKLR